MKKVRTILESIRIVLKDAPTGMTYTQIYKAIVKQGLYEFGAKKPEQVVRAEIRRHCIDLNFPSASPLKCFKTQKREGNENYYVLIDEDSQTSTAPQTPSNAEFIIDVEDELLREEKIVQAYNHYINDLKKTLIAVVRSCHPSFFEKMVIDLLLAMGYGCDDESGQVIGKSHDGGIDGIISEDKLGLNLIYIQAKRYSEDNSVGRPDVQRFIGAMQKAEKGVFITTSHFTKEAIDFANSEHRKHIRLIDGDALVDLMIRHCVGLEKLKEYVVYKINEDYFSDNT